MSPAPPTIVIALGGNTIIRRGDKGTIDEQAVHAAEALRPVARVVAEGARVALTHGNGPVVGNILIRNEAARDQVPPMPLYIAGADSEGGIGFLLQNTLHNLLRREGVQGAGVQRTVVTLVTQVVVDAEDPAFADPSKPIGPFLGPFSSPAEAARLAAERGWILAEAAEAGEGLWRRVVPSPRPVRIVEADTAARLVQAGDVVIAAGGGGIPVVEHADGALEPVDAVIDKDWASALLACDLRADKLAILMDADAVYADWGTPAQRPLERLTVAEARAMLASDSFARGSIAPKVAACARFVAECQAEAVICAAGALTEALAGRAGTRIVPG